MAGFADGSKALMPFVREYFAEPICGEDYLIGTLSIGERERWVAWVNDPTPLPNGADRKSLQSIRLVQHMAVKDEQGTPMFDLSDETTVRLFNGNFGVVRGLMVACDKLLAKQLGAAKVAAGN